MSYDLVVCVRCHSSVSAVLDTVKAARKNTDPEGTAVFASVDGRPKLARALRKKGVAVYCSPQVNGWGAGLFTLLMESIAFARKEFGKSHFLSIDYDTLFLCPGVDDYVLSLVTDPGVGLVGPYRTKVKQWVTCFHQDKEQLRQVLGRIPSSFIPGEGIHGSFTLVTRAMTDALERGWFFGSPRKAARSYTRLPDDHLLPLVAKALGFGLVKVDRAKIFSVCKTAVSPVGKEKEGFLVFHPVKSDKAGKRARKYFKKRRKDNAMGGL